VAKTIKGMFDLISANSFDVVSQHAFDAPAFEFAQGLPVLHTLHLPPLVPAVVNAAAKVDPSRLATVSQSCRQAWIAAGVVVGHVLPNGVEDFNISGRSPAPYALVAGRISPEKGIEHALAAAARAGLRVRVAGAAYDPDYVVDLSAAETLGLLTRLELRRVMADSLVTICAARWDEPFGLVAAEAQMAGCPVAAYRRGALSEVIDDGVSGALAEPDDIDSLAGAIRACILLDRTGVRSSARRRLGLEEALDRYETVLTEVAR
jgi:glycosyltransferase involved in cell wall biosynthesis